MSRRKFDMYQYRQVLVRMRQGDSDRDIARTRIMGRKKLAHVRQVATQRGWLTPEAPLPDDTQLAEVFARVQVLPARCVSSVEPWRDQVQQWQAAGIPTTAIHAALVREHGYTGSLSSVYRLVAHLEAQRPDDVPLRLEFKPGEAAQIDFGAGPVLTDAYTGKEMKTWFFVLTLCWSRHQYVEFVHDQAVATWLGCHRRAFEFLGGCVVRLIIDNPKCAITRACVHEPTVQRSYAEFLEGYGVKLDPCPPRDPQKKGIVESGVKYVKSSFLPLRAFRDLADANRQVRDWVLGEAGNRNHGTTRERPLTRFAEVERALLRPLPAVAPELAYWAKLKVHRDAHVQFEKSYYSVPFQRASQILWLKATETLVQLYHDHELVAVHTRAQRPGTRRTLADHLPPAAQAWQLHDTQWCLQQAERIGPACLALVRELFGDVVLIKLRAVQGLLRLAQSYGDARLEAACQRANRYGTPTYQAVKTILRKGLDQQPERPASVVLSPAYTQGGRFCRDLDTLLTTH